MRAIVLFLTIAFLRNVCCQPRIVGGYDARDGRFPYAAFIFVDSLPNCSGFIIADNWVMTAAHCIDNAQSVQVVAGAANRTSPSAQWRNSLELVIHPKYVPNEIGGYDIGLVKVGNFDFNSPNIGIAPLTSEWWPKDRWASCYAVGWGRTGDDSLPDVLQYLHVWAKQSAFACPCLRKSIVERLVCVQGVAGSGPCKGDSGGPLVCGGKAVGVAHMFYSKETCRRVPCAKTDTAVTYMFITPELDWIRTLVPGVPATPAYYSSASNIHSNDLFLIVSLVLASLMFLK